MFYASAMNQDNDSDKPIRIEDVWPGHIPEWYAEADYNVERYLAVMARIYERLKSEGKDWPLSENDI
jgi:hypothetical protein